MERIVHLNLDYIPDDPTSKQLIELASEAYRFWMEDHGFGVVCQSCKGTPTEESHAEVVSIACNTMCLECKLKHDTYSANPNIIPEV